MSADDSFGFYLVFKGLNIYFTPQKNNLNAIETLIFNTV
jgi:hypothetical protein